MSFFKIKIRRVRFWWRLTLAYIRRYSWQMAVTLAAFFALAFFATKVLPSVSQANTVNIGYVGNYTINTLPSTALSLATKTLISVDKSGRPTPSLASHWTISPDGKTYVVFLKDNLLWHDGTSVSAKDISIAISNVQISALNNKAIQFQLPNPISSFLLALDTPVFKAHSFYGTNIYRITGMDTVNGYVKRISLLPNSKDLPKVNIKFYPTEAQALTAFKIGDIKTGSFTQATELESWPNIEVKKEVGENEIVTLFFNNGDQFLGSKELRQSLIHSVDRTELDGQIAHSPISPSNWAYNPLVKKYEFNTGRARELINKSNYNGEKLTLYYIPSLKKVAEKLKRDWRTVGVNVDIEQESQVPANYQIFLTVNKLSPDPDQYALWHSSQTKTNITHYRNVKIDKLLEDARGTLDQKEREGLYADFQRFLVEEAPAAFLYYPFRYELTYKNAKELISKLPKN